MPADEFGRLSDMQREVNAENAEMTPQERGRAARSELMGMEGQDYLFEEKVYASDYKDGRLPFRIFNPPDQLEPGAVIRAWTRHQRRWWHFHEERTVSLIAAVTGFVSYIFERPWLVAVLLALAVYLFAAVLWPDPGA